MTSKFLKLITEDIVLSILDYSPQQENLTTKHYFQLGNKDYDDLLSCKQILENRLNLSNRHFI